jgi:hypothetical protein
MPDSAISPLSIALQQATTDAEIHFATFAKPTAHERRQAVIGALVWG